jgi:hypothetical protein
MSDTTASAPDRLDLTPGFRTPVPLDEQRAARSLLFAGTILGLIGVANVIAGVTAIDGSDVYPKNAILELWDLKTWGWVMLVAGILELAASFAIFTGNRLARSFAIAVVVLNATAQLLFVPAQPVWALCAFAADLFALRALVRDAGRGYLTR